MRRLPVTIISGFLGAGKTSLLHHFITEHRGGHLALMIQSRGAGAGPARAPALDLQALRGLCGVMRRTNDAVIPLPDDVVDALPRQIRAWAESGRYEQVLIELSGDETPRRLARTFGVTPNELNFYADCAELARIICVVDGLDLTRGMVRAAARKASPDELLDFQHAQIETATHLVLNKCDLIDDVDRLAARRLLRTINPDATIIETDYGELPAEVWQAPATANQLALAVEKRTRPPGEGLDPVEVIIPAPALSQAVFRAARPLHPERFWTWLQAEHPGLIRMKGLVWLASRHNLVGGVSRTRWQTSCGSAGIWWDALPREEWPTNAATLMAMQETWHEPYGDRRQELVCTASGLDAASPLDNVIRQLEACLLDPAELAAGPAAWRDYPDPFPEWDV